MKAIFYFLIIILILSTQISCEKPQRYTEPEPTKPTVGWFYDDYIQSVVKTMPELTALNASRMISFCPRWNAMDDQEKTRFWADLLYSMAGPESNWTATAMYWEKTLGIDEMTHRLIVSEGLLQLSYQDKLWYKDCRFNWEEDKEMFQRDWAARAERQSWRSAFPQRTTLVPENNLHCGLVVYRKLLTNPKLAHIKFEDIGGRYWAVMRTKNKAYQKVLQNMKARKSKCFYN